MRLAAWLCLLLAVEPFSVLAVGEATSTPKIERLSGEQILSPDPDALAAEPYRPSWGPLPIFLGETAVLPLLHRLLASKEPEVRARSAFLLGQIGCPDSAGSLVRRLSDPDQDVRVQAGIALTCIGDSRGIPVCAAVLSDAPSWAKYYAVYGLWSVGTPRAKSVLQRNVNNGDAFIARMVREALKTRPRSMGDRYAPTPVPTIKSASPEISRTSDVSSLSPGDVWQEASDAFASESDFWWHAGDYHQCIRCLETALFLKPDSIGHYSTIAWLQWSMGHDDLAVRTLMRGVSAAPSNSQAYFELGFHYSRTKRYIQAERPLRRAVELGGDHRARRVYAHCLERLGKLREAVSQWRVILEAEPEDPAARYNLERLENLTKEAQIHS